MSIFFVDKNNVLLYTNDTILQKEGKRAMKCIKCGQPIDTSKTVQLQTNCVSSSGANPCSACGRLHWPHGGGVFNRSDQPAYFENGKVVMKEKETDTTEQERPE